MKSDMSLRVGKLPPEHRKALIGILRTHGVIRILRSLADTLAADSRSDDITASVRPLLAQHAKNIRRTTTAILERNKARLR